jgi:hypothetical protein
MALARGVAASPLARRADGTLAVAAPAAVPMLVPSTGLPGSAAVTGGVPTFREAIADVRHVRVDVMKLAFEGGTVRATVLRSASADVAHEG